MSFNNKTVLVIQARMGSKRLPGKMQLNLGEYSIIEWVLKRVSASKKIDKFILATSHDKNNEQIVDIARKFGFFVHRGSEKDVLSRFNELYSLIKFDNVVRVCADNPFICPNMIDELITFYKNSNLDYAFNHRNLVDSFYADGFGAEIFSSKTLKKIIESNPSESQREHVTSYIFDNLKLFSIGYPPPSLEVKFPYLKFDVDNQKDLNELNKLIKYGNINIETKPEKIIRAALTKELDKFLTELFPICRSLTGDGNRKTFNVLKSIIPLNVSEISSGLSVYDWDVPNEWNIRGAYIKDALGVDLINFDNNNLHVVSYSQPINGMMNWDELKNHIHVHDTNENAIPYRTTYYKKDWGFCVTKKQMDCIKNATQPYSVKIDSEIKKGSMTYGEIIINGKLKKEILISTYICHPSMGNDNLSGVLLTAFLARHISKMVGRKYSYRFVFVPETIGAITYLALNEESMKNIDVGLVITTIGGPGKFGFKQSWNSSHHINEIIKNVLDESEMDYEVYPFDIHGSDERQYSSQGFRINVATLSKDKYYEYPEYHSSLDNLHFVNGAQIYETFMLYCKIIEKLEKREIFESLIKKGEVMLSRHNLYPHAGGSFMPSSSGLSELDLILWILFYSDGNSTIEDISKKIGASVEDVRNISKTLEARGVLKGA